jgi:6-phosphogluconolactonase (cycloisomerase 2 family)
MIKSLAKKDGGVNHSNNDESTIKMRQADPHSHALVLDPYFGCLAYVPCLGKDLVREFFYDKTKGVIDTELNFLPSGLCTGHPDGPRYLEFHPSHNTMYVVNELSSTVAVFSVNKALIREINIAAKNGECLDRFKGQSTLTLIQSISTLPNAFPKKLNTCGRIALHKSGNFLLVSNRGHQSIAIMRVKSQGSKAGQLSLVGNFHTRGETPRHFQFDHSGQYLIVANQDTDNLAIFHFNQSSGTIKFTGNEYRIPSPNFVCCCKIHEDFIDRDQFNLKSSDVTVMTDASSTNESSVGSVDGNEELTNRKIMLEEQLMKTLAEVERLKREISQIDL